MVHYKSISFFPHFYLLIKFIFLFSIRKSYSYILDHNHITTRLNNGNFLIFTCNGKYTLSPAFIYYNQTTDISYNNYRENLAHFSEEDGGYILFISDQDHHFISPYGRLLKKYSFSLPSSYQYYDFFSVIPYSHINDYYYYYIIYKSSNTYFYFRKYSYCLQNNSIIETSYKGYSTDNSFDYITCQLMKYLSNNVIACFFTIPMGNNYYINCTVFDSENNLEIIKTNRTTTSGIISFNNIKSAVMTIDGRQKALVCGALNGTKLFCAGYDITTNTFSETIINSINNYNIDTGYLSVSYFRETEEFLVSFLNTYSSNYIYSIYSFDSEFNYSYFGSLGDLILGNSCCNCKPFTISSSSYNLQSILFSSLTQKYCFVGNINNVRTITIFYINKEIDIKNPYEIKPSYPLQNFLCENYSIYNNNNNCSVNLNLNNTSIKYLEKCTTEFEYIKSRCSCNIYNNKTFTFSYNCSKKFPYEMKEENKCIEHCDDNLLQSGKCTLNYNETIFTEEPTNTEKITEEPTNTEKITDEPTNTEKITEEPTNTEKITDEPTNTEKITDEPTNTEKITEEPTNTEKITDEPTNTEKITDEPTNTEIIRDEPTNTEKITEEPTNSEKITDEPTNTEKITDEPTNTEKITDEPTNTEKITEESTNTEIITEEQTNTEKITDEPTNTEIITDEPINSEKNTEEPKNTDKITEEIVIEQILNIFDKNDPESLDSLLLIESINNKLDDIIQGNDDYQIKNDTFVLQITSTSNKNDDNNNISTINLGECEKILKREYHINQSLPLLILKIDVYTEEKIPDVQYKVIHPLNNSVLDLKFCEGQKVEVKLPVSIDENKEFKYNVSSEYYNDKCFTCTSDEGTDISLENRRKEFINNNMILCDSDCEYLGYEKRTKKSKCECEVKNEKKKDDAKDANKIYEFAKLSSINLDIVQCYYLLFNKEYIIENIGNYVILSIIFVFIVDFVIFCFKGKYLLDKLISSITKNKIKKNINENKETEKNNHKIIKSQNRSKKKKKKTKKKNNNPPSKRKIKNKIKDESSTQKIHITNRNKLTENIANENAIQNTTNNDNAIKNIKNHDHESKKKDKRKKEKHNNPNPKDFKLNNVILLNEFEINKLDYSDAIKIDKRTYLDYYMSLLRKGHLFIFSFITKNDYNINIMKICLFFFSFALYYTVDALFYTHSTLDNIQEKEGEYDFAFQIPKIIYSNLICGAINLIIRTLSLPEKNILAIKSSQNKKDCDIEITKAKRWILIKFRLFYLISFIFLLVFWFYVSCFCAVYRNTQLYLIKDTAISFGLSLITPFGYYLIPGMFRIPSLRGKKNMPTLYKISQFIQII